MTNIRQRDQTGNAPPKGETRDHSPNGGERLRAMIEASVDCVITIDAQSTILEFNAAAERTFGYAREEVIGKPLTEMIIPPSLREAHLRGMAALLKGGTGKLLGKRVEMPAMRADSSEFPVELTITRIASQKPPLFTAYLRDITERKRAEEALRKSEKLFTAFMDHLPGYAWIKDVEGRYVYINETFLQFRNAVGKTDAELWPAEIASTYRANDKQVIQTKNTLQTIEPFPKDPEHGCQIVSKFPIFDQDGAVVMVGGASVDISELVQAEKALEVQALRYKTLMETSTDSIYVLDAEGNLLEANAAFLRQRGYTAAEVEGLNVADWDARWTRAQLRKRLRKLVGGSAVFETRHRSKDGSLFDVEASATSVRIGGQQLFFCVARDITGRKQAEQALRESEERFRELAENIHEVFWMSDPENTRMIYISPAYEAIWGRTRETLYASPASWMEAIHPEDKERMVRASAHFAQGMPHDNTYRIVRPDGSIRWIRDRGFPVRDEHGVVVRFAGIAEDISERRQAEEKLKQSESQLAEAQRLAHVGSWSLDLRSNTVTWSDELYRLFGVEPSEFDHRYEAVIDTTHPEDRDLIRSILENAVKTREPFSAYYRMTRADGEVRVLHAHGAVVTDEDGNVRTMHGAAQDVTERKEAAEAQERALSLMLATLESTADGILVVNTEGKIVTFNRLFARMWRLPDEILASKEDARALECVLDQLIEPEKFLEKVNYLYQHPEEESFDRLVFKDGRVFERYSRPQSIGGKIAGRVWSCRDVTERRRAAEELEKANQQLRILSRRLFEVQEEERRHLARELHDEVGQALTAAKINLQSVKGNGGGANVARLQETTAILDRLLGQVRQISLDLRPSMLDDLGLIPALRSLLDQQGHRASVAMRFCVKDVPENLNPEIQTTCFRIAQEAITNAVRHANATRIDVDLGRENGNLRLQVRDNGRGFDVDSTQAQTAGLGLIGIKERAALVDAQAKVVSSPNNGTTVEVSLPLTLPPERESR